MGRRLVPGPDPIRVRRKPAGPSPGSVPPTGFRAIRPRNEGWISAESGGHAPEPIGDLRWADELGLAVDLHHLKGLGPARDDTAQHERCRAPTLDTAIEDPSVGKSSVIMNLDRVRSPRRGPSPSSICVMVNPRAWFGLLPRARNDIPLLAPWNSPKGDGKRS
jgi:hypothetical protein